LGDAIITGEWLMTMQIGAGGEKSKVVVRLRSANYK
jgi:hypothetical protein